MIASISVNIIGKPREQASSIKLTLTANRHIPNTQAAAKEYGSKFFLAYVAESCAVCKESRGGFETLQQNFNNYYYYTYYNK